MPDLVHFAIHADDLPRARRFYEQVFGWKFEGWGPPDFYLITTGTGADPRVRGALQKRVEWRPDLRILAYECTIGITDVDAVADSIERCGGQLLMRRAAVPTVGWLVKFIDPEGNVVNAMAHDPNAR